MASVVRRIQKNFPLIPAVTWGFLVLYLTLRPKSAGDLISLPSWMQGLPIDKVAHFVFWGIWFFLYGAFFLKRPELSGDNFTMFRTTSFHTERYWGIAVMIVIGGIIEVAQHELNWGREAEWADFAADVMGVICVALIFKKP